MGDLCSCSVVGDIARDFCRSFLDTMCGGKVGYIVAYACQKFGETPGSASLSGDPPQGAASSSPFAPHHSQHGCTARLAYASAQSGLQIRYCLWDLDWASVWQIAIHWQAVFYVEGHSSSDTARQAGVA